MKETGLIFTNIGLIIHESYKIENIQYIDILSFEYNSSYVILQTVAGKECLIQSSLLNIKNNLPYIFFNCNRSSIVNMIYIDSIDFKSNNIEVVLPNLKKQFKISRRRKFDLMDRYLSVKKNTLICRQCQCCTYVLSCKKVNRSYTEDQLCL